MDFPATVIVHTPSGPVSACQVHADKLQRIFAFLGCSTNATLAAEGAECANCRNEALNEGRPAGHNNR